MVKSMNGDLNELYKKINRCVVHICVEQDGEVISRGSGFCFLPTGEVISAAHTIAGGFPVKDGEVESHNRKITVTFSDQMNEIIYRPVVCPITISFDGQDIEPLQLDIAVILPVAPSGNKFECLQASTNPPLLGEELYFAGYSDEVVFPFSFDRHLGDKIKGRDEFRRKYDLGIKSLISGPIIKRGTVGNLTIGVASRDGAPNLECSTFYLDNGIHTGASGGPIVSRDGTAKGVIVKRAMTSIDNQSTSGFETPSGSTMGIGLDALNFLLMNSVDWRDFYDQINEILDITNS